MKRDTFSSLVFLLFLLICGLRMVHISADPPVELSWSGGLFFDEGALAHNARNKVLFNAWKLDEWNDFYYSPLLTYIKWAVFSLFGIGLPQLRIVPILFSWLTLIVLYLALRVTLKRFDAAIAVFLLGTNYIFLMYNRIGLTETPLLLLAVLTLYFWQLALQEKKFRWSAWWMFLAGLSCFAVYIFKALLIYFLPVPLTSMLLLFVLAKQKTERSRLLYLSGFFLAGMAVAIMLWLALFYYPNYDVIHQAGDFVKTLSIPHSLQAFLTNVSRNPFFSIFFKTPVTLFMAWGYLLYLLYLIFHKRTTLQPVDLFLGFWFCAHFFFFSGYSYRPTRYYIPVIPAMSVLAARGITRIAGIKEFRFPYKVSKYFWGCCWLIGVILGVYWLIPVLYSSLDSSPVFALLRRPPLSSSQSMFLSAIIAFLLIFIAVRWAKRKRGRSLHVSAPRPHIIFAALLIIFSVANGKQYVRWVTRPQYVVRDVSRELGMRLDNAFLAGLATPELCLENTHRALYVWENFFNYRNPFEQHAITHLFLAEFNQEVQYYQRKFSEIFNRAALLKTYMIRGSKYYLYALNEPRVFVDSHKNSANKGQRWLLAGIKNHDPDKSRTLKFAWTFYEEEKRGAAASAEESLIVNPLERRMLVERPLASGTRYMLHTSWSESKQDVYEAENLNSLLGKKQVDPQASGGYALYAPPSKGLLAYGPYWIYPTGTFNTDFKLKYARNNSLPAAATAEPLVVIEVTADGGNTILATKTLKKEDFQRLDSYAAFRLSYALSSPQALEFRVFTNGQTDVWLDTITTSFVHTEHQRFELKDNSVKRFD